MFRVCKCIKSIDQLKLFLLPYFVATKFCNINSEWNFLLGEFLKSQTHFAYKKVMNPCNNLHICKFCYLKLINTIYNWYTYNLSHFCFVIWWQVSILMYYLCLMNVLQILKLLRLQKSFNLSPISPISLSSVLLSFDYFKVLLVLAN